MLFGSHSESFSLRITLIAEDATHSFTIAEYRICKRMSPGQPVKLEFLADKAGTFEYYCSLTDDEKCRKMRGELVVHKPVSGPLREFPQFQAGSFAPRR